MEILRVEGLHVKYQYQKEPCIKDVSFSIAKGEFVILTGKSGCGKSTLIKCINTTIPSFIHAEIKGSIYVAGNDTRGIQVQKLVSIAGTMWQDVESQIVNLKVEDELSFGLENIGVNILEIEKRLNLLKKLIKIDYNSFIHTLSGGQKQRVVMGAVLSMLPELILLDEPLANLDYESTKSFLEFIKELTDMGKSILMVEHRLDSAAHYCNRLLIMENGIITQDTHERKSILGEALKRMSLNAIKPVPPSDEDAVCIGNLNFSYGKKCILNNLSFDIKAGERIVILGQNGCGKTTLLKIISGLITLKKEQRGKLKIFGRSIDKKNKGRSGEIGFVLQNPNHQLFMDTVHNEICLNAFDDVMVKEIIRMFELEELLLQHPLSLSQGQKRLVAIASVVSANPKILLLDEPTIGQDYDNLQNIIKVLNTLNKKYNMTLVTVTHDKLAAKALFDRVIRIDMDGCVAVGDLKLIDKHFC